MPETRKEYTEKLQEAFGSQKSLEDRFMMTVLYKTRNFHMEQLYNAGEDQHSELKDNEYVEDTYDEENDMTLGIREDLYRDKWTIEQLGATIQQLNTGIVKTTVLAGKTFKTVNQALNGQELQHKKAVALTGNIGGYELYEAENNIRGSIVTTPLMLNPFTEILNYNKEMTFKEVYDKLGLTEEEQSKLRTPEELQMKVYDKFDDKAIMSDEECKKTVSSYIFSDFCDVMRERTIAKAKKEMSLEELELFELGRNAIQEFEADKNNSKKTEDDQKVINWQKNEFKDTIYQLGIKYRRDQFNSLNAIIYGKKMIGVLKKDELKGAYRDLYNKNDDYIKAYIKGDIQAEAKADSTINNQKMLENLGKKATKLKPGYDSYIKSHSGLRMGNTPDELVENTSKCMAAILLQQDGYKFDVKLIHKTSLKCREMYSLDALKSNPQQLAEMLHNVNSLATKGNQLKESIYSVKPEKRDKYFDDMKALADNLSTTKGHGKQYKKLYSLIKEAATLKNKGLSEAELNKEIKRLNVGIYRAAVDYMNSKGLGKLDFVRNPRAVTALNAISVLTDSTEGLTYRTTKLISDLHHTFAGKRKAVAADFADLNSFKAKFNAHNAAAMGVQKKTKLNNKAADLNGRVMK